MTARAAANIPALTGIRAFAAGWVLIYHAWLLSGGHELSIPLTRIAIVLTPFVSMGWLGVDVFFILSGFVLSWQALTERPNSPDRPHASFAKHYRQFMRRRIFRVFPAYYACLSVLLPIAWLWASGSRPEFADVALHLVMFHNLIGSYVQTINGVFWSLPFELQFYLVFPFLVVWLLHGRTMRLLLVGVAITLLTKLIIISGGPHGWTAMLLAQLPVRLDQFVVGMVAAKIGHDSQMAAWQRSSWFWAGTVALLAAAQYYGQAGILWWSWDSTPFVRAAWVEASVAAILVGLSRQENLGTKIFGNRIVVWVGTVSYSIYLWHLPVLQLLVAQLQTSGTAVGFWTVIACGVPIVLAVSALSYYFIERPFLRSEKSAGPKAWIGNFRPTPKAAALTAWGCALLVLAGTVSSLTG